MIYIGLTLFFMHRVQAAVDLPAALSRLADEADLFARIAPATLSEETLVQRARHTAEDGRTTEDFDRREIVTAYGYSAPPNAPFALHEFRRVISIDGKKVESAAQARQKLALILQPGNESKRRKLLESFEKLGLRGAVTDFGQIVLLFARTRQRDYTFSAGNTTTLGADNVEIIRFTQREGPEGLTVYRGAKSSRRSLKGEIWVREGDLLPLRITLSTVEKTPKGEISSEAAVDYTQTHLGPILPVSVVYREFAGPALLTENVFHYGAFHGVSEHGVNEQGVNEP